MSARTWFRFHSHVSCCSSSSWPGFGTLRGKRPRHAGHVLSDALLVLAQLRNAHSLKPRNLDWGPVNGVIQQEMVFVRLGQTGTSVPEMQPDDGFV